VPQATEFIASQPNGNNNQRKCRDSGLQQGTSANRSVRDCGWRK